MASADDESSNSAGGSAGYAVEEISDAWERERPGTPTTSIGIVTPIWRLAQLLGDDRRRTLARAGVDGATLDLLSALRRGGHPYELTTRELGRRCMVSAGAVSQRVARAERDGLVRRRPGPGRTRTVLVSLTDAGHELVEQLVDRVLGRESELLDGLTEDQRAQLAELLRLLHQDVQARLGATDWVTQVGSD